MTEDENGYPISYLNKNDSAVYIAKHTASPTAKNSISDVNENDFVSHIQGHIWNLYSEAEQYAQTKGTPGILLFHDNTRPHCATATRNFIIVFGWKQLNHRRL